MCPTCNDPLPITFNIQSFLNNACQGTDEACLPTKNVCYTGPALPCSTIANGDNLEDILTKIDTRLCAVYGDYSTYQKNCLPAAYGAPILDEATFVDAMTSYACTTRTTLTTFTGVTFPAYQTSVAASLLAITSPALTCASVGITSVDSLATVYAKYCTKFTAIDTALNMSGVNFASCFTVTVPPTTVAQGFAEVVSQICAVKVLAEASGGALPTFNNVGSCLAAPLTTTDSLESTISKIKTKLCALPTYLSTELTWGCIGSPTSTTNLAEGLQRIMTKVNYMLPKVVTFGAGFAVNPTNVSDPCEGVTVTLNATSDRLVASNNSDLTPGTLKDKLLGSGIVIDDTTTAGKIILKSDHKVGASTLDDSPDFLINKLNGSSVAGITITPEYNPVTKKIDLKLSFDQSVLCELLTSCASSTPCTGYTVTPSGSSSLSYTDCNGVVVSIASITGATSICARLNTVYAPNATVVNTGACAALDPSLFQLVNNSTGITVSDVLSSGIRFYTISSGAYNVLPTNTLNGTGVTSGAVAITVTVGSGRATLYKNNVAMEVITIAGAGIHTFTPLAFASGDDMKIIMSDTPSSSSFSVVNNSADAVVDSVSPAFFIIDTGSFPVASLGSASGFGVTSSAVTVHVTGSGSISRNITLFKNGSTQQVIPMISTGNYTFSAVTFGPTDDMLIQIDDVLV